MHVGYYVLVSLSSINDTVIFFILGFKVYRRQADFLAQQ